MMLQARVSPYLISLIIFIYTHHMTTHYPNTLKQYRKRAHLLQSQVAKAFGFASTDRISHWERGTAIPSLPNLIKLSILYRANIADLYSDLTTTIEEELEARELTEFIPKFHIKP